MTTAERLRVAADLLDEVGLRPEVELAVSVGHGITVTVKPYDTTETERWRAFVELTAALTDVKPLMQVDNVCYRDGRYRDCRVLVIGQGVSPATAEVGA